jgi:hypothetical protein
MIEQIRGTINQWNKRRRLFQIRRAFERAGCSVGQFTDSQIEAALTCGERGIEDVPISAKIISLALRRLTKRAGASATIG